MNTRNPRPFATLLLLALAVAFALAVFASCAQQWTPPTFRGLWW